jgi:hypothetical protein
VTFYRKEKTIMASAYMIGIFLLLRFVPKDKIRHATVAFLFKQVISWLFGLLVVDKGLIEYPYRPFFKKTYKASFDFEFFLYPVLCALFNIHYPEKRNILIKALYYFIYTSLIAGPEVLLVKYTKLIHYKKWHWHWSFITMWISYYLSHIFYKWLLNDKIK